MSLSTQRRCRECAVCESTCSIWLRPWSPLHGLRGETDTLHKMEQRVRYDLEYLRHWSLWLDAKILFRTLGLVLRRENAY